MSLKFSPLHPTIGCKECVPVYGCAYVSIHTSVLGRIRLWKKLSRGWGEMTKDGPEISRREEKPSCPEFSPSRVAFKGHLLYTRCFIKYLISY